MLLHKLMMKTKLTTWIVALAFAASAQADFSSLVKQGDVYDKQYKPEEALKHYLEAEKLEPSNAGLLVKMARQYVYRMDDLPSKNEKVASGRTALAYAERAVKAAPGESDSHLCVAICWGKLTSYIGNKESVEASRRIKEASEKAVRLNPRSDYAWHLLGRWHQSLAELGGATRAVAKVVYGGLPAASNEEAVKCFQKALSLRSDRLIHHVELGRTYAAMGRTEEARKLIQQGLAMRNSEKDDPETKQRGRDTLAKLK